MQFLKNDNGHIHVFHFILLMGVTVIAVVIIAHVITDPSVLHAFSTMCDKFASIFPRR